MKNLKSVISVIKQLNRILSTSQKRWAIVIFVMSLIGAVVETLGVSAILPLVQAMLEPEKLMQTEIISKICVILGVESVQHFIFLIGLGVVLVYVFKNLYLCFLAYVRVKYSTKVQRELSIHMLYSYMSRGYSFFRMNNTSTLLRGINGAVSGVHTVIYQGIKVVTEILTMLCILVFLLYTDWQMAMSMIVLVGACLGFILGVFKNIMHKAGRTYHNNVRLTSKWSLQLFSGIKEILVLDRKDFFVENYKNSYTKQQSSMIKQTVAMEAPAYIIEGTCVAGIVLAVCIRVISMENAADYIPQLASFAVAAFRLLPAVGRISASMNSCIFSLPSLEEVYNNFIEAEKHQKEYRPLLENTEDISFKEWLRICDVTWKYPDGDEIILDKISMEIRKGESVAFVGASGAGKSTLADVILGLFEPQSGRILIDDIDITRNRKGVSNIISFVPQSVYLIDDTVRRNVAFGIRDKDIRDEDVWNALEQAQMREFVEGLPLGLDTIVGERGVRFSGGQTQRLAIARALYTKPDILVLDEATSALDSETESAVMESIDALHGQKTLIIIAHRLTTIRNCDKIFEIGNGIAVERKYEELI